MATSFQDHFSAVAAEYAWARPEYPQALFEWIAATSPALGLAWEAGCGSGQATRDLSRYFARVHATDPSASQIAQAHAGSHVSFAVEPAERCSLADASADLACVAQALHWFDRDAYFSECARVLKSQGLLVAWGYQDIEVDGDLRDAVAAFAKDIRPFWPAERALVDNAYADFAWPFPHVPAPEFVIEADWPLARMLAYFSSYSATQRFRDATGSDLVARHAGAITAAWGDSETRRLRWPMFVHACRKP